MVRPLSETLENLSKLGPVGPENSNTLIWGDLPAAPQRPPMGPEKPCQLIRLEFPEPLGTLMPMARILFFLFSFVTSTIRSRLSLQLENAVNLSDSSGKRSHFPLPKFLIARSRTSDIVQESSRFSLKLTVPEKPRCISFYLGWSSIKCREKVAAALAAYSCQRSSLAELPSSHIPRMTR